MDFFPMAKITFNSQKRIQYSNSVSGGGRGGLYSFVPFTSPCYCSFTALVLCFTISLAFLPPPITLCTNVCWSLLQLQRPIISFNRCHKLANFTQYIKTMCDSVLEGHIIG